MNRSAALLVLAVALVGSGCRSTASKVRYYKVEIGRVIQRCDSLVKTQKPTNVNKAIRYYNGYIPRYERLPYPDLKPDIAQLYAKRSEAYATLGNARMASADLASAQKLGGSVAAAPPAPPAPGPAPEPAPGEPPAPPAPAVGPDGIPPYLGDPIPIAVLPFESVGGDQEYGKTFGPLLGEDLFNRGRFDLIERSKLDTLMAELKLSFTDLVAKAGSEDAQKILPVKFLAMGTITVEGKAVIVTGSLIDWKTGKTVVTQKVKRICETADVSFYFDEIAHELGVKLEKDFVAKTSGESGE